MSLRGILDHARRFGGLARATLDPAARATFPSVSDYARASSCISYTGWAGHGNAGDEWIFEAIQGLLAPHRLLNTEWGIPPQMRLYSAAHFRRAHPYRARILGGGTLFPYQGYLDRLLSPEISDLPLFVFGLGCLDDSFWGKRLPVDFSPELKGRWADALSRAKFVGVRDSFSGAAIDAQTAGRAEVIGDPALALGDARWRAVRHGPGAGRNLRIGLNLGSHDPTWASPGELRRSLAGFVRWCNSKRFDVTFISLSARDTVEGRALCAELRPNSLAIWDRHDERDMTLGKLLEQDMIVGTRLHSVVLASAFGVPCISLAYNPKCLHFMESFGRQSWAIRTDRVSEGVIEERTESLLSQFAAQSDLIWAKAEEFRGKLHLAAEKVVTHLGNV